MRTRDEGCTHAYKRVNKFYIKLTSIKVKESYNLFRPNNSLKTIGYDILNSVTVPAYKVAGFVKYCDIVKGRNQNPSSLKLENLYITLSDHGYHY